MSSATVGRLLRETSACGSSHRAFMGFRFRHGKGDSGPHVATFGRHFDARPIASTVSKRCEGNPHREWMVAAFLRVLCRGG